MSVTGIHLDLHLRRILGHSQTGERAIDITWIFICMWPHLHKRGNDLQLTSTIFS